MKSYDLAIAWNWEYDADFIAGVEAECASAGLSTLTITPADLPTVLHQLHGHELSFRVFFDRASDADEAFIPLSRLLAHRGTHLFNHPRHITRAVDKAIMHVELAKRGIDVPYSIIIAPYNRKKEIALSLTALEHLGRPFIIKPANTTGGGTGVVLGAETLHEVLETRQHHKNDKYLLQETIVPAAIDGHRAWFRVFYYFGEILPCWWDDAKKLYAEMSPGQEEEHGLQYLRTVILSIQDICKLDFFSSEIARTAEGRYVVVDYVNEVCDMRLQSLHADGVPDPIVHRIERRLAEEVTAVVSRVHS